MTIIWGKYSAPVRLNHRVYGTGFQTYLSTVGFEGLVFEGLVYSEFGRLLTVPRTSVRI